MKQITLWMLFACQLALASTAIIHGNPPKPAALHFSSALLCDACGCSASGGSMGFASMLDTNFIGIRYFNQNYKTTDGLYSNSPWLEENFNTIQIWARIPVHKKIQISTLIPYHFHSRETTTGNQSIAGIGDATLLAMYELLNTKNDSTSLSQVVQLGGGIKVPFGQFDETNNGSFNPSYQLGTGSWDYIITTEYVIKKKQLGFNAMLNYTIKTENDRNYRFGNQTNYAGTFFYIIDRPKFSFVPQLGLAGEIYESNYQLGQRLRNTSGSIFLSRVGFELGKNKWSFGANAMIPIEQNLNGGNVEANYRWSVNLNYAL
jgi:hypothetical protein